MESNIRDEKYPDDGEEFLKPYEHLQSEWGSIVGMGKKVNVKAGSGQEGSRRSKERWKNK